MSQTEIDEKLRQVVARRWRVGATLTAVMMLGYFGFILLVAFAKPFVGTVLESTLVAGRVSIGIVIGAIVIVLAPVLTAIYVRWANRRYDPAVASLRKRGEK